MKRFAFALLLACLPLTVSAQNQDLTGTRYSYGVLASRGAILSARAVPINATGDQAVIGVPQNITKYLVQTVTITNCSGIPVLAQPALYTAASAGGTNVVAAAVITGATSAAAVVSPTVATALVTLTATRLFVNLSVANAGAVTCDFYVSILNLS